MFLNSKDLIYFFQQKIDKLRTNPSAYIPDLQDRMHRFNEQKQYAHRQISNISFLTVEGTQGVRNAIDYIKHSGKKLNKLQLSAGLCQAAYLVGLKASQEHLVTNLQQYHDEVSIAIQKSCPGYFGQFEMLIEYGFRRDEDVIPSIIVDDGNQIKSRRNAILNPKYKFMGLSIHEHQEYDYMLIILLSDESADAHGGCKCSIY